MTYTPDEIREHRKEWLEALESGRYAQTRGMLCELDEDANTVGYCCLGVACEISGTDREINEISFISLRGDSKGRKAKEYNHFSTVLPPSVSQWLGLNSDADLPTLNGIVEFRDKAYTELAALNDDGAPFKLIAEAIKEYGIEEDRYPQIGWNFDA